MDVYITIAFVLILIYIVYRLVRTRKWIEPTHPLPDEWKKILFDKVSFYRSLNADEKKLFNYKVKEFLLNCKITGVSTDIDDTDRLLVAASAVIPIFSYPEWKYHNLDEVLIYPSMFDADFDTSSKESHILGMVGEGSMGGKMILSQHALHYGFENDRDKHNTAIHEFIHLIDKSDGIVDGIPMELMNKQYVAPWVDLIERKMKEIYEEDSDINPYGGTNKAEFLAVASEYYFGRPKLMAEKHPVLYNMMSQMFRQDFKNKIIFRRRSNKIGRNDPCPCGSSKKFKRCCGF